MLHEDLDADGDQDHAAEEGCLVLHHGAEFLPDEGADQTADRGGDSDEGDGQIGVGVGEGHGEGYAGGQRVDAGGDGLGKNQLISKGRVADLLLRMAEILNGLDQHLAPQKSQQHQGDPMVDDFHVAAEGFPRQIADQGHQRLKNSKAEGSDDQFFLFLLKADSVRDRNGEGVHRKPEGQQKDLK